MVRHRRLRPRVEALFSRARPRSRHPARYLGAMAIVALMAVAAPAALAHVQIDVGDGQYVMEIGFRDEPAYVGQPNALSLKVEKYATGGTQPVDGLAGTLQAEITKDGQSISPPLVPKGDGLYEAAFVPTAAGDYTFHITGKVEDATVDESATSGPNTFDSVQPLTAIELPPASADAAQVAAAAQADAALARTLALVGIAVAILGLILGAVAFARSGRART